MSAMAPSSRAVDTAAVVAMGRSLVLAVLAGAASGFLVAGVGGRLAMRLLALTSPEIAQGRLTDDAARVGQFTVGGSLSLALALTVIGALLGPVYLLVRRILPPSRARRALGYALLTGVVGGALLVHDHPSFDYSILGPVWLAVALFIAVPAGYGALTAWLVEVLSRNTGPRLTGPLPRWWRSTPVTIVGVLLYGALVTWGVYGLLADVVSLASDSASSAPLSL